VVLAQAVAAKFEDGNLKTAIRLLVADEETAVLSADGLAKNRPASLSADTSAAEAELPISSD